MFTTNKIFIDSSVLIEALKGNRIGFYEKIISDINNENLINETVISEYLYFVVVFSAGISPRTVKEKKQIPEMLLANQNLASILSDFTFVGSNSSVLSLVSPLMIKYNLLPNDAIILATCKINNITKLASHDSDFILPCSGEGIELLREE